MSKEMLTIIRCVVSGDKPNASSDSADIFQAQLNPGSYQHSHSISYAGAGKQSQGRDQPLGQVSAQTRFSATDAENVSFELVLDGSGVVRNGDNSVPVVSKEIAHLKDIVYRYEGDKHEPSVVKLAWGGSLGDLDAFYGRLTSLQVKYTVFKPSGEPIRARASLAFVSYMTQTEAALRANRSSPDLSHVVVVREGDTLPLLCLRIYNDC